MKIAALGSITCDHIVIQNRNERFDQAGGGVYCSSLALASLGLDVCCLPLLSKKDTGLLTELAHPRIEVIPQWTAETTVYRNIYRSSSLDDCDKEILSRAKGCCIDERAWGAIRSCDAIHVVPLSSDEFSVQTYRDLRRGFDGLIAFDGQGFTKFPIENLDEALAGNVDILKLDETEILQITGSTDESAAVAKVKRWAVAEILVTKSSRGSVIYVGEESRHIPAMPASKTVDATGCGDAYMAGYLVGRLQKYSPEISARLASKIAAKNLEFRGAIRADLSGWIYSV